MTTNSRQLRSNRLGSTSLPAVSRRRSAAAYSPRRAATRLGSWAKPLTASLLLVSGLLTSPIVHGQTIYGVEKQQRFVQTGEADPESDPSGAFLFAASSPVATTLEVPGGVTIPLVYSPTRNDYELNRAFATQADLDAAFPEGVYRLTAAGASPMSMSLVGQLYPASPRIVGASWGAAGNAVLGTPGATAITFDRFSAYSTAGLLGHQYTEFGLLGTGVDLKQEVISTSVAGSGLPSQAQPLTSIPIPAGTLAGNAAYTGNIEFDTLTTVDPMSVAGAFVVAAYQSGLRFVAATPAAGATGGSPTIIQQPTDTTAAAAGSASFSVSATAPNLPSGASIRYNWLFAGQSIDTSGTDPKYSASPDGARLTVSALTAADAGDYLVQVCTPGGSVYSLPARLTVSGASPDVPTITTAPASRAVPVGSNVTFSVAATGGPFIVRWQRNGVNVPGATSPTLTLNQVQPADAGLYVAVVTNAVGSTASSPAILGLTTTKKVEGTGQIYATDIPHPNGNIFDQILVTGPAEVITADPGKVTRTSYIDLNGDIVQVEFSGPGALSLVLEDATPPARPVNYNQAVDYVSGHARIIVAGADERTNLSVFTVGRATAFDITNHYNILLPVSATNVPAANGSPLFVGHETTNYDGVADIASIAILSTNGKFGGLRTANAAYWATRAVTGVYAPGVGFTGVLYVGDINAKAGATPWLVVGSISEALLTGGNLAQDNGRAIRTSGIGRLNFTDGQTSAGVRLLAQPNQGRLLDNGIDVTARIVVNP